MGIANPYHFGVIAMIIAFAVMVISVKREKREEEGGNMRGQRKEDMERIPFAKYKS